MIARALLGAAAVTGGLLTVTPAAQAATGPECPSTVDCTFTPAAYDWSSKDHSNPNAYGVYDPANRPADGDSIRYIVIHDTELSYAHTIKAFQDPAHGASANYVVRASDGRITQMVPNKDVSWGVGNWSMNQHAINIEHEGFAKNGKYPDALYESSAKLVRYLAAKYDIPLDRQHIISHEDVPGQNDASQPGQHWDPGPYWNWQHYMSLLGVPQRKPSGAPKTGDVVAINPDFATNTPEITDSDGKPLPKQGANFVYLRTAPDAKAPLLGDPLLHPDGKPGTTKIDDGSDKAVTGHRYVVAGTSGDWTAIWFGGKKAWFENPEGRNTVSVRASTLTAHKDIPVYGLAFPEKSEYPAEIPFEQSWTPKPLSWTIPKGQSYTEVEPMQAANYYARYDKANVPANHTLVRGSTVYRLVDFNHRYAWVKESDLR
ncbi:N-acetylmuramoyl-L-alanine amidase [Sciscionella sediminilitoris]|uniref:N-acetylmuramoyl-L-alanine amidase n=1 Tax=Sciscionella sediminilitoris TaxID=1445613 RepID=UPI0004DFAB88|nr:peptidoglycan recognition family protein [Sciscionella sp. SE31]